MDQRLESLPDCKGNVNVHNQTKIDFYSGGPSPYPIMSIWGKEFILTEMVQRGSDGTKIVPNGQKLLSWPFWSLLDPIGPNWTTLER